MKSESEAAPSSCNKKPRHVHPSHNNHNEDDHPLHVQKKGVQALVTKAVKEQPAVRAQNEQPVQTQMVAIQQSEAEFPHYEQQQEHQSTRQMDDEQEAVHEEAHTHLGDGSKAHMYAEAQYQTAVPDKTHKYSVTKDDAGNQSTPNSVQPSVELINGKVTMT
ncbi:hypothetical protein U9M48_009421 [Paspalum notatum var. saurae]|uniref:Uncharacterized protein n=1 Tax=Paspalum notatum var. saurae TaxID=547442 RepID=A0AAQ3SRR5_PASNO